MYGLKNLTTTQLYDQIIAGTHTQEVFSVSIQRVAERSAVAALIQHECCTLVTFSVNQVQLKRL